MKRTIEDQVGLLAALSDPTRLRLLALLSQHELSVIELTQVTELGQSKVSMHLARLKEQGLIVDRRERTSSYYRFNSDGLEPASRRLWDAVRESLEDAALRRDGERARRLIEARAKSSWPERMAGELERHYSPGRTWDSLARALAALVKTERVLDVGAGDGTVAELLARRAQRYVCLELSETLSRAAAERLARLPSARVLRGDMHALPVCSSSFDQVLMLNVLSFADEPGRALAEAARVLCSGGELLLVTLAKHEHMDVASHYGHKKAGFTPAWLKQRLKSLDFHVASCAITSREPQAPHFEVLTCLATKG
jgi:ArsR family transcriptional regulator